MRLQYEIQATGFGQLKRVLRSVEQEQQASAKRAANASTRMWARQLSQVKREIAQLEGRGIRRGRAPGVMGPHRTVPPGAMSRAAEMADRRIHSRRMGQLATEEQARQRTMARRHAARLAATGADLTDAERTHMQKLALARRESQARIRSIRSSTRAATRDANYVHRLRLRNIEREKAREISAAARARAARTAAGGARRAALGGQIARAAGGAVTGVARMGLGIGGLMGGFAAIGAVRNQMEVGAAASTLANKALGTPGEERNREQIRSDVVKQARGLGASSGLGAAGVIESLDKFTAISGRLGMGQKLAPFMADVADATGAAIGDVGRTSGQIVQAMLARGMKEPEALAQTQEILTAMMAQAKVGSIEFADLATQMGKLMSSTAEFDGNVSDLVTSMGAVSQLAIAGAASSPEEAMTGILRMRDDMKKNAKRFKKLGVDVFSYNEQGLATKLRDPIEIIKESLIASKGDLRKLAPLFGIRGQKAFGAFQNIYTEKGGGKAGVQAVMDLLNTAMATIPKGEVGASAAFRRQDADKRLAMVVEKFNAEVGTRLLPVITQLIPKFTDLIPKIGNVTESFANAASWAIENPFKGIGALVAAKVTADVAGAQIGGALSKGLGSLLQRAPMGSLMVGTAAFAVGVGTLVVDTMTEAKEKGQRAMAVGEAQRAADIANAKVALQRAGGDVSKLDEGQRRSLLESAQNVVAGVTRTNEIATQGLFETLGNMITGGGPGIGAVMQAQEEQAGGEQALRDAQAMIELLSAMGEMQREAIAEQKAGTAAQRETAAAIGKLAPPGAEKGGRRSSPIVNRGETT